MGGGAHRGIEEGIVFKDSISWSAEEQALLRKIYRSKESIKLGVRRLLPSRSYLAAKERRNASDCPARSRAPAAPAIRGSSARSRMRSPTARG